MFPRQCRVRNLAAAVLSVIALASGCGAQLFLRVDRRVVDERLVYFLGGGGNTVVLLDGRRAFVADVKLGPEARRLRQALEQELGKRVQRVLLTHSHLDHAAGLPLYPDVPVVIVHPRTRARLEAAGQRAPWVEVDGEIELTIGGELVRVSHLGAGHTDGDLVALLPQRRLLVSGDLMTTGYEPRVDLAAGGDLRAMRRTLDRVLALEFDSVVPGHGDPVGRAEVELVRDYLAALEDAVASAQARGLSEDDAVREVRLPATFDVLRPMPFGPDRALNTRLMYRGLAGAGQAPARPEMRKAL